MTMKESIKAIAKLIERSVVVFDIESTNRLTDDCEIIQFSGVRINQDGSNKTLSFFCKPKGQISQGAIDVHGITLEKLKDEKPFSAYKDDIIELFKDADACGYNNSSFDNPLLEKEMTRLGHKEFLKNAKTLDTFLTYKKDHPRKLAQSLLFYTQEILEDAHNSNADLEATIKIFACQVKKHGKDLFKEEIKQNPIDKFVLNKDGDYIINFTKNRGIRVLDCEQSFINWIYKAQFVVKEAKDLIKSILKEAKEIKEIKNGNKRTVKKS